MDAGAALTAEAAASVSGCALPPAIFKALEELAHVPNERKTRRSKEAHWMPVEDAAARSLRRPRVLVEQVVQYIYRHVLPFELPGLRGVEWWVHSRAPTEKMHFHFDRDEFLWEHQRVMKHPTVSSVLYVTDAGGPTLVLDQRHDGDGGLAPAAPLHGYVYEPDANSFATFSGDLLHGVLPSGRIQRRLPDADVADDRTEEDVREGARRVTLLMNWWCSDVTDEDGALSAELSQEERWAYGAVNSKLKWAQPNKRMRRREPLLLEEEVRSLYTYDIAVDDSSSEDSEGGRSPGELDRC
mmetsp:Transcript_29501/g.75754  ORF Transcript_29501/g.75754 Transcript_29501/m.75754 type:complete len:298 (+) Transcript_29501:422-1315(+)